jgi:hypothetical protein
MLLNVVQTMTDNHNAQGDNLLDGEKQKAVSNAIHYATSILIAWLEQQATQLDNIDDGASESVGEKPLTPVSADDND